MKSDPAESTAIVLAAGKGERYDGIKQLETVGGRPVLQHVLDSVNRLNWKFDPLLILGYESDRILASINPTGFKVIENDAWRKGMSTSFKLGVRKAPESSSGFTFFLGDMPLINPAIIDRVLNEASNGASIVAPVFDGVRGFPVYLHREWRSKLLDDVTGDTGAREIIEKNRQELTPVPTEDRGVILDLNEKGDLPGIKSYLNEEGRKIDG